MTLSTMAGVDLLQPPGVTTGTYTPSSPFVIFRDITTLTPLIQECIAKHWYGLCWAKPLMLVEQKLVDNHTLQDDRLQTFMVVVVCRAVEWD